MNSWNQTIIGDVTTRPKKLDFRAELAWLHSPERGQACEVGGRSSDYFIHYFNQN
jgi:hypothetical protein